VTDFQRAQVADDGTTPKFLKVDSNRNLYVTFMGGFYVPCTETYAGSSCTGIDGAVSRVLTLSNPALSSSEMVVVDKFVLEKDVDYTIAHAATGTAVTFLVGIYDNQRIVVRYFI
jgi:hypothetical protein